MTLPLGIAIERAASYGLLACVLGGLYLLLGAIRASDHTPRGEVPSKRQVVESAMVLVSYTVVTAFSIVTVGYVLAVLEQVVLA